MPTTQPFNIVADDIFKILGLTELDEAEKRNLLTTMLETIQNRVIARVLDNFDESERNQLDEYFGSNNTEGINKLFQKRGMDSFSEMVAQEALLYKLEMANRVAATTPVTA